jgi:hypothetical protein
MKSRWGESLVARVIAVPSCTCTRTASLCTCTDSFLANFLIMALRWSLRISREFPYRAVAEMTLVRFADLRRFPKLRRRADGTSLAHHPPDALS